MVKGLASESATVLKRHDTCAQHIQHGRVVCGIDEHDDGGKILGGGANHRRATNVDLLQRVHQRDIGLCDCFGERVEVDGDKIDRADAVLLHLCDVGGIFASGKNAAVDAGMEGLDAAIQYLRKAGQGLDMLRGDAGAGQEAVRAAGGVDFPSEVSQAAREIVCAVWMGR